MDVAFGNRMLQRRYESGKERRKYPPEVGRRYAQRVNALYDAADWSAIERFRTFRAHRLTGGPGRSVGAHADGALAADRHRVRRRRDRHH